MLSTALQYLLLSFGIYRSLHWLTMGPFKVHVLILACGNTLRSDDGVGPWLADWAAQRYSGEADVCVISRQQWTPDLAEDIAGASAVLFIDCSLESAPGSILLRPVQPATPQQGLATHHQGAAELLDLARALYAAVPAKARMLTIGAGSIELGESLSQIVKDALPQACSLTEEFVRNTLAAPHSAGQTTPHSPPV